MSWRLLRRRFTNPPGAGLTSITLALLGFDGLSTDLPVLVDGILSENIARNARVLSEAGSISASALDWTTDSESWAWPSAAFSPPFDLIVSSDSSTYNPYQTAVSC